MRVVITEPAELDLFDILSFVAADNPRRAKTFVAELERFCMTTLAATPRMGAPRDDIRPGLRVHARKGYLICYRISNDVVYVVRIFHGSYDITRRFGE